MRVTGRLDHPSGLGRHDHVCWTYEGADELREAVVAYLADGLAEGQRVAYTADAPAEALREVVAGLGDVDALTESGSLLLLPIHGVYDAFDPAAQVAAYTDLTCGAVRDGHAGFRIAAEATPLVREPEARRVFTRYEHLVDRYMAAEPFGAMCAYDRATLDAGALDELACVHPAVHGPELLGPFRLYSDDATTVALGGEVDAFSADLFGRVLDDLPDGPAAIDVAGLDFIDHRGLLALECRGREHGGVTLTHAAPAVERLHGVLRLEHVALV